MINGKNILTRIRAADDQPPAGAYAVEIPDNRYVTGNLLSQHQFSQTKDEDNGVGNMGTSTSGGLNKTASDYLEKIASVGGLKSWPQRLVKNIKEAEPLTQLGIGMGTIIGVGKAKAGYDNMTTHKQHASMEEKSLRTLQAINRNLAKAVPPKSN